MNFNIKEISYDKEADVLYIEFRKGEFATNKKFDDLTILDLDKDGNVLGIEILDASKRICQKLMVSEHPENLGFS